MSVRFFPPRSAEDDVCVGRILPYESHHGEGHTVQSVLSVRVGCILEVRQHTNE